MKKIIFTTLLFLAAPLYADDQFDLAKELEATLIADQKISIYVPNKDKDGNFIDQYMWVNQAVAILTEVGGGATSLSPAIGRGKFGVGDEIIESETVIVYTYFNPAYVTDDMIRTLKDFFVRMGKDCNLDIVFFDYQNKFYRLDINVQ